MSYIGPITRSLDPVVNYISNSRAVDSTTGWLVYKETDPCSFQNTGDTVTQSNHGLSPGTEVTFLTISVANGLTVGARYYVINPTTNTFQVSTTVNGSAVAITADSTGTYAFSFPRFGTGGIPNITWSRSTAAPLRGVADFNIVKDAVNRIGEGVSYAFTVDPADLAKVLTISFDYEVVSGTFVDGDLEIYLIQDPGGTNTLIQPAGYVVQAGNVGTKMKGIATFQTSSSVQNYRLCFHVSSGSASAYTLAVDNVVVGPQTVQYGAPVTDWSSIYSFTPNSFGTVTNSNYKTRRVGDSLEVIGYFTSGTNAVAVASVSLPAGLSIDSSKLSSGSGGTLLGFVVGNETGAQRNIFYAASTTGSSDAAIVFYDGSDISKVYFAQYSTSNSYTKSNASSLFNSNSNISFQFTVPILGWSSTVQMSNDTDTRVVAAKSRRSANQAIAVTTPTVVLFDATEFDTHGAMNTSGVYTIPVSGIYEISGQIAYGAIASAAGYDANIRLFINGVDSDVQSSATKGTATQVDPQKFFFRKQLNAGQTVAIRAYHNVGAGLTLLGDTTAVGISALNIVRLSGPSAIAASETVAAAYWATANQTTTNQINFNSKEYDTHGAVTTGASWRFTAPISGKYTVSAYINNASSSGNFFTIYKNNSAYKHLGYVVNISAASGAGSVDLDLLAGDYIDLRPDFANAIGGNASLSNLAASHIQIKRIG